MHPAMRFTRKPGLLVLSVITVCGFMQVHAWGATSSSPITGIPDLRNSVERTQATVGTEKAASPDPVETRQRSPRHWTLPRPELKAPTQAPPAPAPRHGTRILSLASGAVLVDPDMAVHPNPGTHQTEMTIWTHPTNADIVLAGSNAAAVNLAALSQGWYYSTNGGVVWSGSDTLPTHLNLGNFMSDPAVGIDADGHLFFNALEIGDFIRDCFVVRSTNHGATWTKAVVPDASVDEDKNHMAIDISAASPYLHNIYTAYTDFTIVPSGIDFSRSTDRGATFSAPVSISDSVGFDFAQGINLAVGTQGHLYATWSGYDTWPPPVTTRLGFNKSTNGGATWQGAFTVCSVMDLRGQLVKGGQAVRVSSFPSMAVDRGSGPHSGWLYIVYPERTAGGPDIFLVRSTNGGTSWSSPVRVNQDTTGLDQWYPWISVDPTTGILFVVYYDSRNFAANDSAEVFMSVSLDGGFTFEDVLVSDASFLPTPIAGLADGYMGDYIGVSALDGVVWPCWNDNRTGVHQGYTSRMLFIQPGTPATIRVTPDTLDFGDVYIGYPEPLPLSVRNMGFPDTLTVTGMVPSHGDFSTDLSDFILPGGVARSVQVTWSPAAAGPTQATLAIASDDTAHPLVEVTLLGEARECPGLSVVPDHVADTLFSGGSSVHTIFIKNVGPGILDFDLPDFAASVLNYAGQAANGGAGTPFAGPPLVSAVTPASGSVPAGDSLAVMVTLSAASLTGGDYSDSLLITSNDCAQGQQYAWFALRVIGAPDIALSDTAMGFGTVFLGAVAVETLLVSNAGTDMLHVSGVTALPAEFSVFPAAFSLTVGQSQVVAVSFQPPSVGSFAGSLTIVGNDPDEDTVIVPLSGAGQEPPVITVTPDSLRDSLFTGETSEDTLTLANDGAADLVWSARTEDFTPIALYRLPAKDHPGSPSTLAWSGKPLGLEVTEGPQTPPGPIGALAASLSDLTGKTIGFAGIGGFGTMASDLQARGATVTFPTLPILQAVLDGLDVLTIDDGLGSMSAAEVARVRTWVQAGGALLLQADDESSMSNINALLLGTGISETFQGTYLEAVFTDILPHPTTESVSAVNGSSYGSYCSVTSPAQTTVRDDFARPHVAVSTLGSGRVMAAGNEVFADFNLATGDTRLFGNQSFDWLAGGVSWLAVEPISGVTLAGSDLALTVFIDATGLNGGDYDAAIVVASNDPITPEISVPVSLHVTGAPDIALSDTLFDYGLQFIGAVVPRTLVIRNQGTDLLAVSSLASDQADYDVNLASFGLNPGDSQAVLVTFAPSTTGSITGTLTIESNDPDESTRSVGLAGVGVEPPEMVVSPDSLRDSLFTGEIAEDTIRIANLGPSDLVVSLSTVDLSSGAQSVSVAGKARLPMSGQRLPTGIAASLDHDETPVGSAAGSAASGDSAILVIQNTSAWGLDMAAFIQAQFGLAATVIQSNQIAAFDLAPYDVIITVGDEDASYYQDISTNLGKFEAFVASGGVLQYQLATQGDNVVLVDSVRIIHGSFDNYNLLVAPGHPIGTGLPDTLVGNAANHCHLEDLPAGAEIITQTLSSGLPTTAVYSFGSGTVIATGMTWEFLWIYGYTSGPILYNAVAFALSAGGVDWLSLAPEAGVVPSGETLSVVVTFDATGVFGGDYQGFVRIESNDPIAPEVLVPVFLHVTGAPDITLSDTLLDFAMVFIGASRAETLTVSNEGTDSLHVGSMTSSLAAYSAFPGAFDLGVGDVQAVVVTFTPSAPGSYTGTLAVASNDPDEDTVHVGLAGAGVEPPEMAVSPDSLSDSLFSGGTSTHILTISNDGVADLEWQASPTFAEGAAVLEQSPAFVSAERPTTAKRDEIEPWSPPDAADIFAGGEINLLAAHHVHRVLGVDAASVQAAEPTLERILAALDSNFVAVNSSIPNRYDFSEGVFGISISDGGNDMYDGGNFLFTQLGGPINYSDGVIVADGTFGAGGRYFTRKYPGLFVLVADLQSVDRFEIQGDLGADGYGTTDGAVLQAASGGSTYYGFAKRTFNAIDPSVNHLILVRDLPAATHEFSTNTNNDYHRVSNLAAAQRLYYLLYAGANGSYVDNTATLGIMAAFLDALVLTPEWVSVTPESGTVPSGGAMDLEVELSAVGLLGGAYQARIVIASNDPVLPVDSVPVFLHVTGAPDIALSDVSLDFGAVFIGASRAETLVVSNEGTDSLHVIQVASNQGVYSATPGTFQLGVGEEQAVVVTFAPGFTGSFAGTLAVASNDPDEDTVYVGLTGAGVNPPVIAVSPDSLGDTLFMGQTSTHLLTVSNSGMADLVINLNTMALDSPQVVRAYVAPVAAPADAVSRHTAGLAETTAPPPELSPWEANGVDENTYYARATAGFDEILPAGRAQVDRAGRNEVAPEASLVAAIGLIEDFDTTAAWPWSPWVTVYALGSATTGCAHDGPRGIFDPEWHFRTDVSIGAPGDELSIWFLPGGGGRFYLGFGATAAGAWSLVASTNTNQLILQRNPGYGFDERAAVPQVFTPGLWYRLSLSFDSSQHVTGRVYASDGTTLVNSLSAALPGLAPGGVALRSIGGFCGDTFSEGEFVSWLSVSPGASVIPMDSTAEILVNLDAAGLAPGDYAARIVIESNDLLNPEVVVPVSVTVLDTALAIVFEGACPSNGTVLEGGAVAVQVTTSLPPALLTSLDLVSTRHFGLPAVPIQSPDVVGLDSVEAPNATSLLLYWEPQAGEAGPWDFCFEAVSATSLVETTCVSFDVIQPGPNVVRWQSRHYQYLAGGPFAASLDLDFVTGADSTFAVVGPFRLRSNTTPGPFITAPIDSGDGLFSVAMSVFEERVDQNPAFNNDAISPDSLVLALVDLGGSALPAGTHAGAVSYPTMLSDIEGIFEIDTTLQAPNNKLTFVLSEALEMTPDYAAGCYAVTIARNLPATVLCPVSDAGTAVFGDLVQIPGFSFDDPDLGPGPYAFSVVSSLKNGLAAAPAVPPTFTGDRFEWQTSDFDDGDVGVWEFCVQVDDGESESVYPCCFTVEVVSQVPVICFEIGSTEAYSNADVCVPLTLVNLAGSPQNLCEELGGFELLFTYDASMLTFRGLDLAGSVLEAAGWEYFTYRILSGQPARVRIVALADMNNSNQHPSDYCIDGLLALLCFRTSNDRTFGCQSATVRFWWDDCGDNTASSRDGNTLFIITDPYGDQPWFGGDPLAVPPIPGGGVIDNSDSIQAQWATFEGGITGPAAFPCENSDTTKPSAREYLCFLNGKIKIMCPGDIDDRGDLNLNHVAYEVADAVLYSNFFISGPGVFVVHEEGQIAASDINADGTPLTVSDLVYLIRVITGDAVPVEEDLLGGGPKRAEPAGGLEVSMMRTHAMVSLRTRCEQDLGAAYFDLNLHGAEVVSVEATGSAADMDVIFNSEGDRLRVLLFSIEDRARVAAGTSEVLLVHLADEKDIALERVEAATFEGRGLESRVSAEVLPQVFALHPSYPNPFNPSTSFALDLPVASEYTVRIFNIAGQLVKTFAGYGEAGTQTFFWDGRSDQGNLVASGVYLYKAEAGGFNQTRKMMLLK